MKVGDRVVIVNYETNVGGLHGTIHTVYRNGFRPYGVMLEGMENRDDINAYVGVKDGKVPMAFEESELKLEDSPNETDPS